MARGVFVIFVCALAGAWGGGCSDSPQPPVSGGDAGVAPPPIPVLGACADPAGGAISGGTSSSFVLASGDGGLVPRARGGVALRALARIDGGFCDATATTDADGGFTLSGVPAGTYLLGEGTLFSALSSRAPDLGFDSLGRPDARTTTATTIISLFVAGLSPWQTTDELQFLAPNVGTTVYGVELWLENELAAGATELSGARFDYDSSGFPTPQLLEADRGDEAALVQLVSRTAPSGLAYRAAAKIVRFAPFTLDDGIPKSLFGTFADIPQDTSATVDWRRSQFMALASAVSPVAVPERHLVNVSALPGGLSRGLVGNPGDLAAVEPPLGSDDLAGTITFGNPHPESWTLYLEASHTFSVEYALPGRAATPNRAFATLSAVRPLASGGGGGGGGGGPIVPVVGPVLAPRINGQSLFSVQTKVGTTPTIDWTAPALGTPIFYTVTLRRLFVPAGSSTVGAITVATLRTASTSVTVPPGILKANESYYARITAEVQAGVDPARAPLRLGLPSASASLLSARILP